MCYDALRRVDARIAMQNPARRRAMIGIVISVLLFAILTVMVARWYLDYRAHHHPQITTEYHSVSLRSGELFYGKIFHLGSDHPVLRQALRLRIFRDGSTSTETLIVEWLADDRDGSDHLILRAEAINYVRPVNPASPSGKAIQKAALARFGK